MISIAGVIGGALFVGSGNVIYSAGPAVILAYALGGLLVLFIMRMLGEMVPSLTQIAVLFPVMPIGLSDVGQAFQLDGYIGVSGRY